MTSISRRSLLMRKVAFLRIQNKLGLTDDQIVDIPDDEILELADLMSISERARFLENVIGETICDYVASLPSYEQEDLLILLHERDSALFADLTDGAETEPYFSTSTLQKAAELRTARQEERLERGSRLFSEAHTISELVVSDQSPQETLILGDLSGQGLAGQLPVKRDVGTDEIQQVDSEAAQGIITQNDGGGDDAL